MKNLKSKTRNAKPETRRLGTAPIGKLLLLAALLLSGSPFLQAQPLSMDWFSFDGGGGTSTGGVYSLSGTIGQPDAGTMSGGLFTLEGGFWSVLVTVTIPGGPTLSVSQQGAVAKIAWRKPASGWVLNSTPALSGPTLNWTPVAQAYQDDGANLYITLNPGSPSAFFRLEKP